MKRVHRIEIVIDARNAARVIELLAAEGLHGYTLIRGVGGAGERGRRLSDDIAGVSNNHYILTTCAPEALEGVKAALRPLLERVGGICLISDAHWLLH